MLRLRRVEIFGFKSFAERTRILFNGSGVAAVVGPNGCGKSNISDSILWVLGEQSAKTLRSGRMADCIFNGTATRPPTNLAEVTLTLVDPEAETAGLEAPVATATAAKQEPPAAPADHPVPGSKVAVTGQREFPCQRIMAITGALAINNTTVLSQEPQRAAKAHPRGP